MAFWSTEKIKEVAAAAMLKQPAEATLVKPFDPARLDCGSYRLTVGPEIFITSTGGIKRKLDDGKQMKIPPGQVAILVTEEEVHVPKNAIGFISMRASVKLGGLVNVSGFHVDPGYAARLKFSVYNAGDQPAVVTRGDDIFLIWFADLDRTTDDSFNVDPKKHGVITSADTSKLQGTMPTPTALKTDIEQLRVDFEKAVAAANSTKNTVIAAAVTIATGVIVWALTTRPTSPTDKPATQDLNHANANDQGNAPRYGDDDRGSAARTTLPDAAQTNSTRDPNPPFAPAPFLQR